MAAKIIAIARWQDENASSVTLQNFVAGDGGEFIPLFSSLDAFREQVKGTGFEAQGVAFELNLLGAILRGDERLVLDPGYRDALPITPADLTDPDFGRFLEERAATG